MRADVTAIGALGHSHGGISTDVLHRHGLSPGAVCDFSMSVSPLGPPVRVRDNWNDLFATIDKYPSVAGAGVKKYYAQRYGLPADCILSGNGSVELMYRVFWALRLKRAAVLSPSFFDYQNALQVAGAQVECLPVRRKGCCGAAGEDVLEALLARNDALVVGNPNNPDGVLFSPNQLVALADKYPQKYVVVDEAFLPFLVDERERTLLRSHLLRSNLIVFHSLTKIFALPGIRIGCAVSTEGTIARVAQVSPPWMINSIADAVAPLLLSCDGYVKQVQDMVVVEMAKFKRELASTKRVRWWGGAANFVLATLENGQTVDALQEYLLQRGMFVRDCRNFQGLEGQPFRFCVRSPTQNDALMAALCEL